LLGTSATLASTHAKLGLAVFVAAIVMPLLAASTKLRTHPKTRQPWRESHFVLGYFILVAGLAACVLGLQQARLYVKNDAALNGLAVLTYLGCGFLLACVMLISFNRVNKLGVDEVRAARERIAAINQAKSQEAHKAPADQVSLRPSIGNSTLAAAREKESALEEHNSGGTALSVFVDGMKED
jgi:hypothetical protein